VSSVQASLGGSFDCATGGRAERTLDMGSPSDHYLEKL
jgi:hypothetical protein